MGCGSSTAAGAADNKPKVDDAAAAAKKDKVQTMDEALPGGGYVEKVPEKKVVATQQAATKKDEVVDTAKLENLEEVDGKVEIQKEEEKAAAPRNWMEEFQEKMPFSQKELEALKKKFKTRMDVDQNKTLDFEEFQKHVTELGDMQPKLVKRMFKVFDRDNSGTIDMQEFLAGLSACAKGTRDEKMEFAFDIYDVNGDGTVDREELSSMLRSYLVGSAKLACQAVEVMDIEDFDDDFNESGVTHVMDADGLDPVKRLEIEQNIKDFTESIFKADANKDGSISRDEFMSWVKDPKKHMADERMLMKWIDMFSRQLAMPVG